MHTLAQLRSGAFKNATRLTLTDNLTQFPTEIFDLADTLETLDLSNNQLSQLPEDLPRLHQLKHLFLNNNQFESVPECLQDCPSLDLISFKSNRVRHLPENALPKQTRWLILTDNQLKELPNSLGNHARLQKLMLAGNQLTTLPDSLEKCSQLQLIRLSANQLSQFPKCLLALPNLAWVAFSGNPFCRNAEATQHSAQSSTHSNLTNASRPTLSLEHIELHEVLGQGASGVIHRASMSTTANTLTVSSAQIDQNEQVAIKLFKGEVTSDGYPQDELHANLLLGAHPNLVEVLAQITDAEQSGIVMNLIPDHYFNLGLPPDLVSCTRDRFVDGMTLTLDDIVKIAVSMADALVHLHTHQLSHGDVYAHNILIDDQANVLFGDFGASTYYGGLTEELQQAVQQIEIRAYGWLLDDLLSICDSPNANSSYFKSLVRLQKACVQDNIQHFTELLKQLKQTIAS
ncbi:leucine-rich repeat-containing protein kinase family protein [Hydrogenovibrio kuenenii]|uniref:leucine-rich repeat-containing protein kinase family protein n=1 Tax=Hydrogenovibrio kuenenii TaxID=63658 RepID=UPI00046371BB|nr:protein kinase [Hydrogenovibrio kuenenii]